ncbi:MAG: hypothetical protein KatS3mg126_2263 [Lysobacteraceae bacterium]|nr:MAG: hypothetical protein KatS3mg126_2263 [Xanthomonadaceae bacterium]
MSLGARHVASLAEIGQAAWQSLQPQPHVCLDWHFLAGLERCGCLHPRFGWTPSHLLLEHEGSLVGAAPCYLKTNSHGEFVFDQAWARAHACAGLDYYPKLLCAVPYSPVTGPRLLDRGDPAIRRALLDALRATVDAASLSSAHVNFHREPIEAPLWLPRFDWLFEWRNRGWHGFEDFLAALTRKRRRGIEHDRRQVRQADIRVRRLCGPAITTEAIDAMHGFYLDTFHRKGNFPALTAGFFRHLQQQLADRMLLVLAERQGRCIAGALFLRDEDALYGRYWGSVEHWPGLHFELCYYQGIEFCIEHGIPRFEPGVQGEHKFLRGFLPVRTHSSHYLRDPRLRAAVAASLLEEARWLEQYRDGLMQHQPYRRSDQEQA